MIALQAFCAFYLAGVIWVIQLIHYPAFAAIRDDAFASFHQRHSNVMTAVVGPVMLIELGGALWLARTFEPAWILNLASVLVPFVATFALSVPLHNRLGVTFDASDCRRLVRTNWIRTLAWTGRAVAFLTLFIQWGAICSA